MENFQNDYAVLLVDGVDADDTTLIVSPNTSAPDPNFRIRVEDELMLVTDIGVSGANWTVQRGIEGTTAAAHAEGTAAYQVVTVGGLLEYVLGRYSDILDQAGSTRGQVLYRGASGWQALAPGAAGQFLSTGGAGADPSWATVSSGLTIGSTAISSGGTNRILFQGAASELQQSSLLVYDSSANRMGVGVAAPSATLHVLAEGTGAYFQADTYRTSAFAGGFSFGHARGTKASPSYLSDADRIASIFFKGFSGETADLGDQTQLSASIEIFADGAHSSGVVPGKIVFGTATSNTSITRLTIQSTAITSTVPVVLPAGAVGAPAINFGTAVTNGATTGIWANGNGQLNFSSTGTQHMSIRNATGAVVVSGLSMTSSFAGGSDTFLTRLAAGNFMISADGTGASGTNVGAIIGNLSSGNSHITYSGSLVGTATSNFQFNASYTQMNVPSGGSLFFSANNTTIAQMTNTSGPRVQIGSGSTTSNGWTIGYYGASGLSALWSTASAIGNNDYTLLSSGGTDTLVNGSSRVQLRTNNVTKLDQVSTAGAGPAITAGTATTDVQALSVTQTLNNAGVSFTAARIAVTNTTSAGVTLLNLQATGGAVRLMSSAGSAMGTVSIASNAASMFVNGTYHVIGSETGQDFGVAAGGAVKAYASSTTGAGWFVTAGTATTDVNALSVTQTWNQVATTFTAFKLNATDTTSASTSMFMDLQLAGTSKFYVRKDGFVQMQSQLRAYSVFVGGSIGAAAAHVFIGATADGVMLLQDSAGSSFGRLMFGGITSSFPALKRSGAEIYFRLADDSGYTSARMSQLRLDGGGSTSTIDNTGDGILLLRNNGATDFSRLQFGGTTSSYPAIKRSSADLHVRLADDSNYANLSAGTVTALALTVTGYASINSNGLTLSAKPILMSEQTAPSAPAADGVYIYAQDNGAGKTQLMALFSSGAAQQIAIQP